MTLKSAVLFSHELLKYVVHEGDFVVDATVGNGNDTVFLAQRVKESGHVFGFDIQKQAIDTTQKRLNEAHLQKQVSLFHAGHETFHQHVSAEIALSAAIFNLGFLPKGDKTVITQPETTLLAVQQILKQLKPAGLLILVVYYGHVGGEAEKAALLAFATQLDQTQFNVLHYHFLNQKNAPPFILAIEKRK